LTKELKLTGDAFLGNLAKISEAMDVKLAIGYLNQKILDRNRKIRKQG
jgi:hypothetical protein